MDGYLYNKPEIFVDDLAKLYRLRRREAQAKKLEFADPKAEVGESLESTKESPPPSPSENQLQPQPIEDQPQLERKIVKLCTPDIRRPTNLEPHKHQEVVRDQDLNNPHGATFTLPQ
jgi:hypothetical protein